MKIKDFSSILLFLLIPAALSGCGSDSGSNQFLIPVSSLERAQPCINCHRANLSPGTGAVIADEWRNSTHNTRNAAVCADCHEPAAGHPNICSQCHGGIVMDIDAELTRNPDVAGKCLKCHDGQRHPDDPLHSDTGFDTAQGSDELAKYSYLP